MERMKISEMVACTGGKLLKGNPNDEFIDIGTDSRVIKPGMLFVALVGETFDGNDYAVSAVNSGAIGAIVSREMDLPGNVILVDDTLKALGQIAAYYRSKFQIPFVGITGSVGKTTTKDMIACVLSKKFNVLKTKGNFNNQIGLPLTLLRLEREHQIGVTEMGMSGFGEIDALASMVKPDTAVFTNIGLSHIEKLGSRENILKAKTEMLRHITPDGLVVLCGDDDMLWSIRDRLKNQYVYYGIENEDCDIFAKDIQIVENNGTKFTICHEGEQIQVVIPVLGEHNIKNALAAYAVAIHYGVTKDDVVEALKGFKPGKMRQNILQLNGITVINDCYNASPSSVEAGLKILNQIDEKRRKVAVLGDMLEMGAWAPNAHKLVGKYVVDAKVDFLITVGQNSRHIAQGAIEAGFPKTNLKSFDTNEEVIAFLDEFIQPEDIVLVKGSRGMKLEVIVEHIIDF